MEKLFAYGTLLDSAVQMSVFGKILRGVSTCLKGYRKTAIAIDNVEYPNLQEFDEGIVDGIVFEITEAELLRADEYEGEEYKRIRCTLENGVVVWIYIS